MTSQTLASSSDKTDSPTDKLRSMFDQSPQNIAFMAGLSGAVNLLMLTGPIFMMQVYDRVLSSQSVATLAVLLGLVSVLYMVQAALDGLRGRVSARLAARADAHLAPLAFAMAGQRAQLARRGGDGQQPLRDLDTLRQFRGGPGPLALFDLPWTPVYLLAITAFHPLLGLIAVIGAVILLVLTVVADRVSQGASKAVSERLSGRNVYAETGLYDSETLSALGIFDRLGASWSKAHTTFVGAQLDLSDRTGKLTSVAKGFRFLLQSITLAAGALLVIRGELSAGSMMATSVLSSRALAPIEQTIGQWRGFISAKAARERLKSSLALLPQLKVGMDLPPPVRELAINNLSVVPTGQTRPLLAGITLALSAGDGLGVIGPSGAGKTTLLRGLLGIWPTNDGAIRLDNATPDQWHEGLRSFTGYLPQETRLLPGTVLENIAGFDPAATSESVLAATRLAGVHDMILALPDGYDFRIGDNGQALSSGQRQRIALARAVYGDPFLVVMDEPNAHLDAEGDAALAQAIGSLREAGKIVVCIAHRPAALAPLNLVLMIEEGRMRAFGPKDEILGQVVRHPRAVHK